MCFVGKKKLKLEGKNNTIFKWDITTEKLYLRETTCEIHLINTFDFQSCVSVVAQTK